MSDLIRALDRAAAERPWPLIRIDSAKALFDRLEPFLADYHEPPWFLFRGHADSTWKLEPSLLRIVRERTPNSAQLVERLIGEEFMAKAHLFPEAERLLAKVEGKRRLLEQWSFMQHYSCPTRMLDWTASAFVAAYFAVSDCLSADGAIVFVKPALLDAYRQRLQLPIEVTRDELSLAQMADHVIFQTSSIVSARLKAQQGHFSVNTRLLGLHDGPIIEACSVMSERTEEACGKILIPSAVKLQVLRWLRAMNLTPDSLFGSFDGFGRSIGDLARIFSERARISEAGGHV